MASNKCMMVLAVVAGLSAGAAFAGAYSEAFSPKVLPRMSGWVRCANPGDWTVSSDYREADGIGYVKVSMTAPKPTISAAPASSPPVARNAPRQPPEPSCTYLTPFISYGLL